MGCVVEEQVSRRKKRTDAVLCTGKGRMEEKPTCWARSKVHFYPWYGANMFWRSCWEVKLWVKTTLVPSRKLAMCSCRKAALATVGHNVMCHLWLSNSLAKCQYFTLVVGGMVERALSLESRRVKPLGSSHFLASHLTSVSSNLHIPAMDILYLSCLKGHSHSQIRIH